MEYKDFVRTIARGMGMKVSYNGNEVVDDRGARHWICGNWGEDWHAESAWNGVVIIRNEDKFEVIEGESTHFTGTLRKCINVAKKIYK